MCNFLLCFEFAAVRPELSDQSWHQSSPCMAEHFQSANMTCSMLVGRSQIQPGMHHSWRYFKTGCLTTCNTLHTYNMIPNIMHTFNRIRIIPKMLVYGARLGSPLVIVPPARSISRTWVSNQNGTRGAAFSEKYVLASCPCRQICAKYSMRGCRMTMMRSLPSSEEASSADQQGTDASGSWHSGETRRSHNLVARSCRHHHTSDHKPVATIYVLCSHGVEILGAECHSSQWSGHSSVLTT